MNRTLRVLTLLIALLLCLTVCPAALADGEGETARDLTADCAIVMPEALQEKAYRITDGWIESYQAFSAKHTLEINLPADQAAQGAYFEWYTLPKDYLLEEYDATGTLVSSYEKQPFVNCYFPIDESVTRLSLVFHSDAELSDLRIFGAGTLPTDIQRWEPTLETTDMLYIASTPQAAVTDFFGVLAAYTVEHEIPSALVVLARETRTMQEGLLAGLWKLGVSNYPQFGSFESLNNESYKRVRGFWGVGTTTKFVQSTLARYNARIVLTHTPGDLAYDAAARYCAEVVQNELAQRGEDDYTSVQKLYLASPEGATTLDWSMPLILFDGESALEAANEAYTENPGMQVFHKTLNPAAVFQLDYTTVGEDTGAGDLLENIDTAALTNYIVPTPSPTPSPEPTPEPTPQPTPQSLFQEDTPQTQESSGTSALERYLLLGAAGLLLLGALIGICVAIGKGRYLTARYSLGRAVFAAFLPLLITGALAAAFLLFVRPLVLAHFASQAPQETAASATPMPADTPESTQEPVQETTEPEAETTEDAAATTDEASDADDQYFRSESDPPEVVVADAENGHWDYRTDTLSILIDRTIVTEPKLNRIYTAEIRMRGEDAFRTMQAAENRNGMGSIHPWVLARDGQCVLMVTGDNLIQSDDVYKGIIIRGGIVFQDRKAVGSMAMYPDMTIRLIDANSTNASELLMDGARDVFSFGPVLVSDGVVNSAAAEHRLSRRNNPRTGIGMIEPGHYIVIVVDGRQPDYSVGMLLDEFAQLFVEHGCKVAYNLDGGVSACMVFMGEQLNRHGNKRVGTYEDSYQRRIPDGLAWGYSDLVPDSDDPIYNTGTSEVPTP